MTGRDGQLGRWCSVPLRESDEEVGREWGGKRGALIVGTLVALMMSTTAAQVVTATAATTSSRILVYGPTSGGLAETTPGVQVTVWNEAQWSSASTADFSQFDAIVFGDEPICFGDTARWNTAVSNRQVWSAAVSGNVIINGTDPDFHGKSQFVHQSLAFAAADAAPGPGLYVSLSCAYHSTSGAVPVELLEGLGRFTVTGVNNCPIDAHKIAAHPTLDGLDDAYLSNWFCSTHEIFVDWPGNFQPLVIIRDAAPSPAPPKFNAPDGTSGHVYVLARGASFFCDSAHDTDGDCLTDDVERSIGTDPNNPDTDGDGLIDSWEVDPGTPGAGVRLPSGEIVHRDAVFGPYSSLPRFFSFSLLGLLCPGGRDEQRRITVSPYRCQNHPPNPLHKDVYLELDWQDCFVEFACPEIIDKKDDPLHHAPHLGALRDVRRVFSQAPVSNPDGLPGASLSILVDEAIPHTPNCDQNSSIGRSDHFGTVAQRRDRAVMEAKTLAVRYVWSGHSSAKDSFEACPNPAWHELLRQGLDLAPLESYDWSPFGDANVGGRDILVTLGPVWSCSSDIGPDRGGNVGPCFRETDLTALRDNPFAFLLDPGIFPASVPVPGRGNQTINWPLTRLVGELEDDAIRQIGGRALMHLLGHSLGLPSDLDVRNEPAPAGRHQAGDHNPLTPLPPESYARWDGLQYAPLGIGTLNQDRFPNYDELAKTSRDLSDPDNDGVLEHDDNCPGVYNPDQDNTDFGPWYVFGNGQNIAEFGDACEPDIDGDGQRNPLPGTQARSASSATLLATADTSDPFPFDTDNDGVDNVSDPDDDGDGVADTADDCRIHPNPGQLDTDGDGLGDVCDLDADGDGFGGQVEVALGSQPGSAGSTPEYVALADTCSDGIDNDADGSVDGADGGCADRDGDTVADADDNCPDVANPAGIDRDNDGIGDACQFRVRVDYLAPDVLGAGADGVEIGWSATGGGTFTVRVDGAGCGGGTVVDSGAYDPGSGAQRATAFTIVDASSLSEGPHTLRVCVSGPAGSGQAEAQVVKDTVVPDTSIESGPAEGEQTGADVTFTFGSTESPVGFGCSLDGKPVEACEQTATFAGLATGSHTLVVFAVDLAGNADPVPATRSFTVGSRFRFAGFFAPVENPPVLNRLRAGQAVPVRFSLGGDQSLDVFAAGFPASGAMDCATSVVSNDVTETVTAGASSLTYDPATDTYTYVWKTVKAWAGTCRELRVRFFDGTEAKAWFQLR